MAGWKPSHGSPDHSSDLFNCRIRSIPMAMTTPAMGEILKPIHMKTMVLAYFRILANEFHKHPFRKTHHPNAMTLLRAPAASPFSAGIIGCAGARKGFCLLLTSWLPPNGGLCNSNGFNRMNKKRVSLSREPFLNRTPQRKQKRSRLKKSNNRETGKRRKEGNKSHTPGESAQVRVDLRLGRAASRFSSVGAGVNTEVIFA